jgi:hypothetical protein
MITTPSDWVSSNLYYDGVQTHGPLHAARMARVFYRRMAVEYQKVAVMALASVRPENADAVIKSLGTLRDLMFPGDGVERKNREAQMREIMKSEGEKSYKVQRVYLGDKRRASR